jgi:hypothetical protein
MWWTSGHGSRTGLAETMLEANLGDFHTGIGHLEYGHNLVFGESLFYVSSAVAVQCSVFKLSHFKGGL